MPTGLLLINLGTPDAPTTRAVRRYLREFLSDPRIIDIHPVARALLLHLVILRTRPRKSARAYRKIWDATRGSPLLAHSKDLAAGVQRELGESWRVELAMRYGRPSIADALAALHGCERIVVLPLFPQYAASTRGTLVGRVLELAAASWDVTPLDVVPPFHADPGFLGAWTAVAAPALAAARAEHVVFSFHSIPVRQHERSGCEHRSGEMCCREPAPLCYRAQCYATARALAERLGVTDYTVAFQSRLGRIPWLEPYTDRTVVELAGKGVKRLAVVCPAFVADCLETVEEIGLRARDSFKAAGGEELVLVPSLNASPAWIEAVCAIARRHGATKLLPVVT